MPALRRVFAGPMPASESSRWFTSASGLGAFCVLEMASIRSTALSHLVGWTRSYLNQLDLARAELEELQRSGEHADLGPLYATVLDLQRRAKLANVQATERLRAR
jgi:hypothetical protein